MEGESVFELVADFLRQHDLYDLAALLEKSPGSSILNTLISPSSLRSSLLGS